jgi:hypothetical protein
VTAGMNEALAGIDQIPDAFLTAANGRFSPTIE